MRKPFWLAALVLVCLILVAEYDLTRRVSRSHTALRGQNIEDSTDKGQPFEGTSGVTRSVSSTKGKLLPDVKTKEEGRSSFDNQFLQQAQQIGQVQNDPESAEIELKTLARQMQPSDIKRMRQIAEDVKVNGDDRALAVELLGRNQTSQALHELADFVVNQENMTGDQAWSRSREFETVLRAQAVEGIGIYPERSTADSILQEVGNKVSDAFVKDRIARTRASLRGAAPTPEQQDEQALRKLVE